MSNNLSFGLVQWETNENSERVYVENPLSPAVVTDAIEGKSHTPADSINDYIQGAASSITDKTHDEYLEVFPDDNKPDKSSDQESDISKEVIEQKHSPLQCGAGIRIKRRKRVHSKKQNIIDISLALFMVVSIILSVVVFALIAQYSAGDESIIANSTLAEVESNRSNPGKRF